MGLNYLTIEKFAQETGYSEEAVRSKLKRGQWRLGSEYVKAPDNRILISVKGFEEWASGSQRESDREVKQRFKSTSTIKIRGAGKVSSLSPPPLT